MKKLLLTILFSSLTAMAANKEVEPGYYEAIDKDKGTTKVQMNINEDGTAQVALLTKSVFKPDVSCEGTWTVQENSFMAALECDSFLLPFIEVAIDITNVTPESVRAEYGVEVGVQLDILGPDPRIFLLKKIENLFPSQN
jgi:hypothetical protein